MKHVVCFFLLLQKGREETFQGSLEWVVIVPHRLERDKEALTAE